MLNHVQPKKYHRDKIYFSIGRKAEEEEGRGEGGKKNDSASKDENIQ